MPTDQNKTVVPPQDASVPSLIIPIYFAWFCEAEHGFCLLSLAYSLIKKFILANMWPPSLMWTNLPGCFKTESLHCTAKYCGSRQTESNLAYALKAQNHFDQHFLLPITALYFTPRTIGARVVVASDVMLALWDNGLDDLDPLLSPTATAHITLAIRPGVVPAVCGRDLATLCTLQLHGNMLRQFSFEGHRVTDFGENDGLVVEMGQVFFARSIFKQIT